MSELESEVKSQVLYQESLETKIEELLKNEPQTIVNDNDTEEVNKLEELITEAKTVNDELQIQVKMLKESSIEEAVVWREEYEKRMIQLEEEFLDKISPLDLLCFKNAITGLAERVSIGWPRKSITTFSVCTALWVFSLM